MDSLNKLPFLNICISAEIQNECPKIPQIFLSLLRANKDEEEGKIKKNLSIRKS